MTDKEIVSPEAAKSAEAILEENATAQAACDLENPCIETESPAESISEATDAIEGKAEAEGSCPDNTCEETESTSEALSEATDAIEGEAVADGEPVQTKNFHAMSKDELVETLEEIVNSGRVAAYKEVALIKQSFYILRNKEIEEQMMKFIDEGNAPEAFVSEPDALESRLKELTARFREMRTAHLEAEQARLATNLARANDILAEMNSLLEDIDNINLNYNKFRELQQQFRDIKEVPATAETDLWKRFQKTGEEFYDRLKVNRELRDLDFRKNLEAKEALVAEAVALTEAPDPLQAFRRQQELQSQWREIGPVAKEVRDEIWNRFREASTTIFKRHQDYFTARKAEEMAAQSRKVSLCEKVESINTDEIKSAKNWDEETRKIIAIQAEWKEAGFASRKINNQLFNRFREACDKFFNAKAEFYKNIKSAMTENYEKKVALCEKVEAMKESLPLQTIAEIRSACDKVVAIQEEWRTIGQVTRKQSDAIWKRFCDACNYFFELRKEKSTLQRKEESENLAIKRSVITRLKEIDVKGDRKEGIAKLRELQAEWQATGHVPMKHKNGLQEEYRQVVKELSDALDVRGHRERMTNFGEQVEKMSGNRGQLSRELDRLYRALDGKRTELKTAENNLGFFNVKSSAGNSLLQEAERRIARIKEDMNMIQQKIDMLKSKMDEENK